MRPPQAEKGSGRQLIMGNGGDEDRKRGKREKKRKERVGKKKKKMTKY